MAASAGSAGEADRTRAGGGANGAGGKGGSGRETGTACTDSSGGAGSAGDIGDHRQGRRRSPQARGAEADNLKLLIAYETVYPDFIGGVDLRNYDLAAAPCPRGPQCPL